MSRPAREPAVGMPVKVKGARGSWKITRLFESGGRTVYDVERLDQRKGPYRTVARDRLVLIPARRKASG